MALIWYTPVDGEEEQVLEIDVVASETHNGSAEVTEHPVESGANKTDHVRPRPVELRIEGLVSNAAVTPQQSLVYDAERHAFDVESDGQADDRAQVARDILEGIRTRGDVVALQLGSAAQAQESGARFSGRGAIRSTARLYEDLAIVELSFPRDRSTGDALRFSATFRQIETATSQTVDAPVITKTTRAKPRQDAGNQNPKTSSAPDAAAAKQRAQSFMHAMFGD
jgi:hypothetical protein